ncbi:MAG: serine hydrolase domain-containing protein [Anaerovorax sp.]
MDENFSKEKQKLDRYLKKALENYDLPGLAVGVSWGDFSYENTEGFRDFSGKEVLKPAHIFHMASVTKLLVATSILQLALQGALDLEEPVIAYLPWFEMADERYKGMTIKQLLSHTAGMPDLQDYHWDFPETDEGALERFVRSDEVKKAHLLWGPEENRFAYSNIGFEILGVVIAHLSGLSFEEYVRRNIFVPFHMEDSTLLTFERNMDEVCTPHMKDQKKHIVKEPFFPYNRAHGPSSTFTSNLGDLKKFGKGILAIYNDHVQGEIQVLDHESLELAWEEISQVPNNGERICMGWFQRAQTVTKKDGSQDTFVLYGHEGTDNGFRASFWICPRLNMHIAVTSNISNAPVKKINKAVFQLLMSEEPAVS